MRAYLAQFYPLHEYIQTTNRGGDWGENFTASGRLSRASVGAMCTTSKTRADKGRRDVNGEPIVTDPAVDGSGDAVTCADATRKDARSKPPARFTEGR